MNDFEPGARVGTPYGCGTVVYKRMAPPSWMHADCYSIYLDHRANDPKYEGTIVAAAEVTPFKDPDSTPPEILRLVARIRRNLGGTPLSDADREAQHRSLRLVFEHADRMLDQILDIASEQLDLSDEGRERYDLVCACLNYEVIHNEMIELARQLDREGKPMIHERRAYQIQPVESTSELADKLTDHTWCCCQGFAHGRYLFLNDAFSEDGAQEYAVVNATPGREGLHDQYESVTFGWMTCERANVWLHEFLSQHEHKPIARVKLRFHEPKEYCHLCR